MKFISVLIVLFSTSAMAALQTNHLLTPVAGQHEIDFTPSYTAVEYEIVKPNMDTDYQETQTYGVDLNYAYGISDDQTFSANLEFDSNTYNIENYVSGTNTTTSSESDLSGIRGLTLQYLGKGSVDPIHYSYSVAYRTAIAEPAADNLSYTQSAVIVGGGVFRQLESAAIVGLTMQYTHGLESDYTDAADNDYTLSGGNSLETTLFYEFAGSYTPQIALVHQASYASFSKPETGPETSTPGNTVYGPRFSMRFKHGDSLEIIPSLTYLMIDNKSTATGEYDTYNNYKVAAAFRFLL